MKYINIKIFAHVYIFIYMFAIPGRLGWNNVLLKSYVAWVNGGSNYDYEKYYKPGQCWALQRVKK